jgi:hypothetical protein
MAETSSDIRLQSIDNNKTDYLQYHYVNVLPSLPQEMQITGGHFTVMPSLLN